MDRNAARADAPRRATFEALVREHQRSLHAHVRLVYPSAAAESVVNDTFAAAWRHFDQLDPAAVAAWLRATARHIVLNASRSERRWRALTSKVAQLDPPTPSEPADSDTRLFIHVVTAAMSSLPQADRELLAMCALEDLSTDDLAAILDVRPDAAKARLSRARARLRSAVEQLEQGDHEGRLP